METQSFFEKRSNTDRRGTERRAESRPTTDRRTTQRRVPSRVKFVWKSFKRSVPFLLGVMGTSLVVALVIGVSTRGLETMWKQASLAMTALNDPTKLNKEQKAELKKMIKNKGDAKKAYETMTPDQKAQAKQRFGNLNEEEQKRARELFGK
jgi:DNA-directed RNA polymerase sigma subunit (sigma70/sigma32)